LIRKFIEAKTKNEPSVIIWGSGAPLREFLYVDDMADACVFLMNSYSGNEFVNIGVGEEISIKNLAELIRALTRYEGKLIFDTTKLDGTPRKLMDVTKLNSLGWKAKTTLEDGLRKTIDWYMRHIQIK
ncbi:NAD-dependent epimerase/dehydratase family protein, partial [bacterium]|nr:NAD-dependent epimerase/dehydratase family protein [bacterium]